MILGAADAVVDDALGGWGSPADTFPPEVRDVYIMALPDPACVHAICEEYRAATSIDREHDAADRRRYAGDRRVSGASQFALHRPAAGGELKPVHLELDFAPHWLERLSPSACRIDGEPEHV